MLKFSKLLFCLTFSISIFSYAQAPTPAQIEQFKKMSPSQQKALAESMGIDISQYIGTSGGTGSGGQTTEAVSGKRAAPSRNANSDEIEKISEEGTDDSSLEEDNEPEDTGDKLKLFGYDIFQFGAESFTPPLTFPSLLTMSWVPVTPSLFSFMEKKILLILSR